MQNGIIWYKHKPFMLTLISTIIVTTITFILVFRTNPFTPAGHEGYVYESPRIFGKGGFRGTMTGPSNYGISIWRNMVENIDIRPKTYNESFAILAKDELNVSFRFQMVMKIKPNSVKDIVENYAGNDYYKRYIKEPLRSFVRNSVQTLESRAIKDKRKEIATVVKSELKEYIGQGPFVIISAVVGNIDFPGVVTKAVEKKLAAKQLLDEKATQKQIAKEDAAIRIEEAKGIAEAQKIINSTLTANYLQHEAIQAQLKMAASPNHTTVYIPSGANGIPIIKEVE